MCWGIWNLEWDLDLHLPVLLKPRRFPALTALTAALTCPRPRLVSPASAIANGTVTCLIWLFILFPRILKCSRLIRQGNNNGRTGV